MTGPLKRLEKAADDVKSGLNTGVVIAVAALAVSVVALVVALVRR